MLLDNKLRDIPDPTHRQFSSIKNFLEANCCLTREQKFLYDPEDLVILGGQDTAWMDRSIDGLAHSYDSAFVRVSWVCLWGHEMRSSWLTTYDESIVVVGRAGKANLCNRACARGGLTSE